MDPIKSPADTTDLVRFHRAILEIDLRNAGDPHLIRLHGHDHLKEQLHAEMVTAWIWKLQPSASEALLLAARAHHLRRWAIPREDYPTGRSGYLKWRLALKELHAAELGEVLQSEGYPAPLIERAQTIVQRRTIATDPDQQALEDAICLTFLETQLAPVSLKLVETKLVEILRKTLLKMSPAAVEAVHHLHLSNEARHLLSLATHRHGVQ